VANGPNIFQMLLVKVYFILTPILFVIRLVKNNQPNLKFLIGKLTQAYSCDFCTVCCQLKPGSLVTVAVILLPSGAA